MGAIAKRIGRNRAYPVAADTVLKSGEPVLVNSSGYLVSVAGNSGKSAGVITLMADNSGGANGAFHAEVAAGEHKFANAGDITIAHVGAAAYFVDADTLSNNDSSGSRMTAGKIIQVDSDGVWVELGI